MQLLVTGGCGFIGSNFIRLVSKELPDWQVVNLDALTYAACLDNLKEVDNNPLYSLYRGDIRDPQAAEKAAEVLGSIDAIINFAAESHVDNSIKNPDIFVDTNIVGTMNLLRLAHKTGCRYLQVSTDEVYGSLDLPQNSDSSSGQDAPFTEMSQVSPNSPYSASKASADHFVNAWHETYGVDTVITRCSNNYGPYQFPEKLIPLAITNLLEGKKVPVYGDGKNVRDWIHVEDHCRAILSVLMSGKSGEVYNVGASCEKDNLTIVKRICELLGMPDHYEFVNDRPGHDRRYSIDSSKAMEGLSWEPKISFDKGFQDTVEWYKDNESWWKPLKGGLS